MNVQEALGSLFLSFVLIGGLATAMVIVGEIRRFLRLRAHQLKATPETKKIRANHAGLTARRREDPFSEYKVLNEEGSFVHLKGPEGRRLILSRRKFENDFEISPF